MLAIPGNWAWPRHLSALFLLYNRKVQPTQDISLSVSVGGLRLLSIEALQTTVWSSSWYLH